MRGGKWAYNVADRQMFMMDGGNFSAFWRYMLRETRDYSSTDS